MPEILALTGLAIATLLYFLLVRRRATDRLGILNMHRALAASNEIALQRMRSGMRRADPEPMPDAVPPAPLSPPAAPAGEGASVTPKPTVDEALPAPEPRGDWRDGVVVVDRRDGADRRDFDDRRRGRGRRTGADRRRGQTPL